MLKSVKIGEIMSFWYILYIIRLFKYSFIGLNSYTFFVIITNLICLLDETEKYIKKIVYMLLPVNLLS